MSVAVAFPSEDLPHCAGPVSYTHLGLLKSLDGETRVVMESTGNYHAPVAWLLHDAGLYVSVVMHQHCIDYGDIKPRVVEQPGHWRVVITRGFQHHTGLAVQAFEQS